MFFSFVTLTSSLRIVKCNMEHGFEDFGNRRTKELIMSSIKAWRSVLYWFSLVWSDLYAYEDECPKEYMWWIKLAFLCMYCVCNSFLKPDSVLAYLLKRNDRSHHWSVIRFDDCNGNCIDFGYGSLCWLLVIVGCYLTDGTHQNTNKILLVIMVL